MVTSLMSVWPNSETSCRMPRMQVQADGWSQAANVYVSPHTAGCDLVDIGVALRTYEMVPNICPEFRIIAGESKAFVQSSLSLYFSLRCVDKASIRKLNVECAPL